MRHEDRDEANSHRTIGEERSKMERQMHQATPRKDRRQPGFRFFYAIGVRSWWVWLFVLISYAIYDFATVRQEKELHHFEALQVERQNLLAREIERHESLLLQMQSQSDPMWIEMMLMRELGVVPEGQTKVVFQ